MAKFLFLICIVVALVLTLHARPQHSKLDGCIANMTLPAVLTDPALEGRMNFKFIICFLQRFALINDDKTFNNENFERFVKTTFVLRDPHRKGTASTFQDCGTSAVAAAKANETTLDIYGAWAKCISEQREEYPIDPSENLIP